MKVHKLHIDGSFIADTKLDSLLAELEYEIESMEIGRELDFRVTCEEMTEEAFNNLPEFDGF